MMPRGVLLVLVVLLATSASARLVGITTGSNYTVGLSVLNETSGFSTVGSSTWGWSLSNLASGFMTLLDNYNGQKAVVTFNVSSGAIVSSLTIITNLSIDAISYDPTSSNVLVIQQDWVNGAIQVGVLSTKDGSVKNVAALSGFLFVGATNAVDPATGLLYLAAQDVNGNYTLFGVTFSGAVKVNVSLQLEGIDDVSGFVVCNSKLFGIGTQAWPNQTIDVISINTKSGSITQMNILQDSGLTVYLGLTAVNPTANLLYFGTAEGLNTNAVVTVVNVSSRAIVSDAPIQGMVTAAWAYTN